MDINKVVSNKVYLAKKGFNYFIGYKDPKNNRPSCIFLSKKSHSSNGWLQLKLCSNSIPLKKEMTASVCFKETQYL